MDSHAKDLENYVNVARNRRRRAKALLDFERHDDDELGFRKNDVITVSSGHVKKCLDHMGLDTRKPVFRGLRTTRAQTSLPICAV